MYQMDESTLRDGLIARQDRRNKYAKELFEYQPSHLLGAARNAGIVEPDDDESTVSLIERIVDARYPEIDLDRSGPPHLNNNADYVTAEPAAPGEYSDLDRTDYLRVYGSFSTQELASSPFAFVAYANPDEGDGLVKVEATDIRWVRGFDPLMSVKRPVVVVDLSHLLTQEYVQEALQKIFEVAHTGEAGDVIDCVNNTFREQGWNLPELPEVDNQAQLPIPSNQEYRLLDDYNPPRENFFEPKPRPLDLTGAPTEMIEAVREDNHNQH